MVILNGRVMDPETGLDAVRNVGIKDGQISRITSDAMIRAASPEPIEMSLSLVEAPALISATKRT